MVEKTWDKFETALLIDTYNDVDSGAFKKEIAIAKLSVKLRKRATNLGYNIDSKFRNTNGIAFMLRSLVYLFSDGENKSLKMPSTMFRKVYGIYKNNREEYKLILAEAKKQCSDDFDVKSLSMQEYRSIFDSKEVHFFNYKINNNNDLLKVRYFEYCEQKIEEGKLAWVDPVYLVHWLDMIDIRLKGLKVITTSIFDSNDYMKFYQYRITNDFTTLLRQLVGKNNTNLFASYIDSFVEYVEGLSIKDKEFLGFSSNVNDCGKETNTEKETRNKDDMFNDININKTVNNTNIKLNDKNNTKIDSNSENKVNKITSEKRPLTKFEANLQELENAIGVGPFYEYYKKTLLTNYTKTLLFKTINNIYLVKQAVHVHHNLDFTCASIDALNTLKLLDDDNKIKRVLRMEYPLRYISIYGDFKSFIRAFTKWEEINRKHTTGMVTKNSSDNSVEHDNNFIKPDVPNTIEPNGKAVDGSDIPCLDITKEKIHYTVFCRFKRKVQIETVSKYLPYLDVLNDELVRAGKIKYGIFYTQDLPAMLEFRNSDSFIPTLKQHFKSGLNILVGLYFDYLIEYLNMKLETVKNKDLDAGLISVSQNEGESRIGELANNLKIANDHDSNVVETKMKDEPATNQETKSGLQVQINQNNPLNEEEKIKNQVKKEEINDLLIATLRKIDLKYVDKRSKGGCLWVEGGQYDESKLNALKELGATFSFASMSGALGNRDGWWTKDVIKKINEEPDPAPVKHSSETYENFIHMLNKYYSKGFRVGSGIEIKKFKSQWQSEFNKDMPSDSIINKFIDDLTITIGKKAYLPDILLPAQIKEKIFAYIRDSFASDKHMIYYEALYNHFSQELLNSHINNSNMLQAYLRRTNYVNHFYLCEKYFSDIKTIHMDPVEDVRKYLTEAGKPVNIDQIYADLSQISSSEIYRILTGIGSREFINNQKGEYFHVSIVDLSSTDIKNIKEIIDTGLYNYGFISGIDFWNKLKKKHPDMIAQYPYLTDLGMRSVLAFHLGDNYDFRGTIISKKGEKVKSSDVYRRFAQQNTEFTIDDLLKLSEELNTGIYYDEVYNYSVRINDNKFISRELIDFDVDAIDSMLESFCESDYASLETLSIFSGFPYCGYAWNIWLLESFVAKYSKKFILLHSNYNATKCVGAIVKISADINTFDELLSRALADSSVQLTQNMMDNIKNALSYFVQNGFLARKSYSTIESIVNNAIKLR